MITIDDVVAKYSNMDSDADIGANLRKWGVSKEQIDRTIAELKRGRDANEWLRQIASLRSHLNGMSRRELVGKYLSFFSSDERIVPMLNALIDENDEDFWLIVLDNWMICDNIWQLRTSALSLLQERKKRLAFDLVVPAEDQVFFNSLPDQFDVYRGCSSRCVRGLSWTTNKPVASFFANGTRFPPPDPVVATAAIRKRDIFFATNRRSESEIVLNPSKVRNIRLETFAGRHVKL